MPFRVNARTILHLGAELISSDAIAFYELIKNAFDAKSKRVDINVVIRLSYDSYRELCDRLNKEKGELHRKEEKAAILASLKEQFILSVDSSAPQAKAFKRQVKSAESLKDISHLLAEANYILIEDTGEGMSLKDLNEVYLTIGTRSRLKQREQELKRFEQASDHIKGAIRPILGEKGVGRLSTMRLGDNLQVMTTKAGESKWNLLRIDWSLFTHESDELIDSIKVAPQQGDLKKDRGFSGTSILISGLNSEWTQQKLEAMAVDEFSKLTDPFVPSSRYPIALKFNGKPISIPRFDKIIFETAHATVEAELSFDDEHQPILSGKVDYRLQKRNKAFRSEGTHLVSISAANSVSTIQSLGPFKMRLYWFNRSLLTALEGIGTLKQVRDLVARWAGGLMVFRDGFRVNPYGSPEDDWLDLDKKALAASGYKVNRRQIIGKVDISAFSNPSLVDQTNREGLRDCDEKRALKAILQHIIRREFKAFLDAVDKEVKAREPLRFDELEERLDDQGKEVQRSFRLLLEKYPQIKGDRWIFSRIQEAIDRIIHLMQEANSLAESYQKGRTQTIHLAGLGLMVEIIAHELNRATSHTLMTLENAETDVLSPDVESLFTTLRSQLKTLQKRLRVLDPLSTSGRQVKESFDLIDWVQEIMRSHDGQFKRHGIRYTFSTQPKEVTGFRVHAVKGMIVQILENLISNSVYWLKWQKKLNSSFAPHITVTVNTRSKEIHFTDNGPGIDPARKEEIFQPFVSTKPPDEGKGLGLFISREIADYNGAVLYLSDERTIRSSMLNTFVLAMEAKEK